MSITPQPVIPSRVRAQARRGFSLVELLIVIAIIAILSSILLPALAKAKSRAQGVYSLSNTRQLTFACLVYSDDHNSKLPYNLGANASGTVMPFGSELKMEHNWVNNFLDWELRPDNTNAAALLATGLGPYTGGSSAIYRCPADNAVSSIQQSVGWEKRVRSYSMNAMIGNVGGFTQNGYNVNNPGYVQFFKYTSIPRPSDIFVFVEEHPDSINDGYFLNRPLADPNTKASADLGPVWYDLPSSHHDGSGVFAFADGHAEMHRWRCTSTRAEGRPQAAALPRKLKPYDVQDLLWVRSTMSVDQKSDYYHY